MMKLLLIVTDSLGDANHLCGVELEDTYPYRLEMMFRPDEYTKSFVVQGNTVRNGGEQIRTWFDMLGDREIDIAVVQVGIVDSAVRVVPTLVYHALPYLPRPIRDRVFKYIHQNRRTLQKLGLRFHFTSVKNYKRLMTILVDRLKARCDEIFIVGITPGRKDVYEHSPGLQKSIKKYNESIREVTSSKQVHYIDLSFMEDDPDKYLSPKLHIIKGGHDYIFNAIMDRLKQDGKI